MVNPLCGQSVVDSYKPAVMPPEDPTAPNNSAADSGIPTGESGSSKPRPLGLQRSDRGSEISSDVG